MSVCTHTDIANFHLGNTPADERHAACPAALALPAQLASHSANQGSSQESQEKHISSETPCQVPYPVPAAAPHLFPLGLAAGQVLTALTGDSKESTGECLPMYVTAAS